MALPRRPPSPPSEPLRKVIMAVIGCLPIGSMGQLLLDKMWEDPAYELLWDYLLRVSEDVQRLEQDANIDLEEILLRPETRPLLNRAIEAAGRSVGEQKLHALRTATIQGIFERQYSFDMSTMVFSLLDRITEGHIGMLQFIAGKQRQGAGGAQVVELKMIGVEHNNDGNGFARPMRDIHGQYFDGRAVEVNLLIAADLENMGLVEPAQETQISAGNRGLNDGRLRVLSLKGELFYEHIFPDAASASD